MFKRVWLAQQRQSFSISLTAAMAAMLLLTMLALVVFVLHHSSSYFWPKHIYTLHYKDAQGQEQSRFARQIGKASSQHWASQFLHPQHQDILLSEQQNVVIERRDDVAEVRLTDGRTVYAQVVTLGDQHGQYSVSELPRLQVQSGALEQQIRELRHDTLSPLNMRLAAMNRQGGEPNAPARLRLQTRFQQIQSELEMRLAELHQYHLELVYADGNRVRLSLTDMQQLIFPNQMGLLAKIITFSERFWWFVSQQPKQANTAGGVFPALFGTVLMVMIMSLIVTPVGVLAAIYLHEYAPQNLLTSIVRTFVNNLAGIPSIVFGVFGLGFFVYSLGGSIDQWLFSEDLPNPTFGSPGIFWAALTMALLTLPVVIVSTEEGLRRVPESLRQGSYALGATQAETIRHAVLPIASPGIMTGIILAVARAAGEVAPLILVGAVKFAPALPIDSEFPYLHLERQFMHLGVMIYDGAFHGQHGSQGSGFMFAACMLLLMIVFALNLIATLIRSTLRRRYAY